MKDKEARKDLVMLRNILVALKKRVQESELDVEIKDCPKCKHPVMAQYHKLYSVVNLCHPKGYNTLDYFQCLTCGSKFTCSNECVCKLLDKCGNID